MKNLQINDMVLHKRYGKAKVVQIMELGPILKIKNTKGKIQLAADSGTTINRFLEDNMKFIRKVS